jgi:hypothetical protein
MEIVSYIFICYLIGVVIIAARLGCPAGHVLLSVETMHIFVGSRKSTDPDQDIELSL